MAVIGVITGHFSIVVMAVDVAVGVDDAVSVVVSRRGVVEDKYGTSLIKWRLVNMVQLRV